MKTKSKALFLAGMFSCVANFCFAYQYDGVAAYLNYPGIKAEDVEKIFTKDIKQATEYTCNSFENADIKASFELEYELSGKEPVYVISNPEYINKIFFLVDKGKSMYYVKISNVLMKIENKSSKRLSLNMSKSIIEFRNFNYKDRPFKNKDKYYSNYNTKNNWLVSLNPGEKKIINLYPKTGFPINAGYELLGKYYFCINDKFVSIDLSGKINQEKLHWKADPSLERNVLHPSPMPALEVRKDITKTSEKFEMPDWAL